MWILVIVLYKVILSVVDKTLKCDYSNECS